MMMMHWDNNVDSGHMEPLGLVAAVFDQAGEGSYLVIASDTQRLDRCQMDPWHMEVA